MTTYAVLHDLDFVFTKNDGTANSLGIIKTFQSGTNTPLNAYTDSSGDGAASSFTLDALGRGQIWLVAGTAYRIKGYLADGITLLFQCDYQYGNLAVSSTIAVGSLALSALANGPQSTILGYNASGVLAPSVVQTPINLNGNQLNGAAASAPILYGSDGSASGLVATGSGGTILKLGNTVFTTTYQLYKFLVLPFCSTSLNADVTNLCGSDGSTLSTIKPTYAENAMDFNGVATYVQIMQYNDGTTSSAGAIPIQGQNVMREMRAGPLELWLIQPSNGAVKTQFVWFYQYNHSGGVVAGEMSSAEANNGMQFGNDGTHTGNVGGIFCYGIKTS